MKVSTFDLHFFKKKQSHEFANPSLVPVIAARVYVFLGVEIEISIDFKLIQDARTKTIPMGHVALPIDLGKWSLPPCLRVSKP
jgi:hypothetical protein